MKKATINPEDINIFAMRLKELIKEKGLINEDIAAAVGVTRQGVGNWVNGSSIPDVLTVARLAKFFGVSVDYLAGNSNVRTADRRVQAVCDFLMLSDTEVSVIRNLDDNDHLLISDYKMFRYLCRNGDLLTIIQSLVNCADEAAESSDELLDIENAIADEEEKDRLVVSAELAADGYGANQEKLEELNYQREELLQKIDYAKIRASKKFDSVIDKLVYDLDDIIRDKSLWKE